LDLDKKIGKHEVVGVDAARGGYFCETCDCTLKDSSAYLDHINGKKRE